MANSTGPPTVLVVRHSGLGDLLTALPALRGVRRAFPDHRLVVTCPAALLPLARALAVADSYLTAGEGILQSAHEDADERIVAAVLARRAPVSVAVLLRVPERRDLVEGVLAMRPSLLCAYRHPGVPETAHLPEFTFEDHILRRWDRLLHPHGIMTDPADLYPEVTLAAPTSLKGVTVVHVGAASPARQWPADRWAAVCRRLEDDGHRVVLTGDPGETAATARVRTAAGLPAERDLAGRTDVVTLAAVVASARLVLSTDTGVAHLATAFRRPSVTLFGAVPPAWWGPPPGQPHHRSLWKGGLGDPYAPRPDPGLLEITVEEVLRAVAELAGEQPPAVPAHGAAVRDRSML